MKRIVILALCVFILVISCGCSGVKNAVIDYGDSKIYTHEDMDQAISVIKNEISNLKGYNKLENLEYAGDEMSQENIPYCNSLSEDVEYDECIVFNSSLKTSLTGSNNHWSWYLARLKNGDWDLLTYGIG